MHALGRLITYTANSLDISSCASDVIVIRHPDGTLHSSPFHVRFGMAKVLRPADKFVTVEVNGLHTEAVMKLGPDGSAFWLQTVAVGDGSRPESPLGSPSLIRSRDSSPTKGFAKFALGGSCSSEGKEGPTVSSSNVNNNNNIVSSSHDSNNDSVADESGAHQANEVCIVGTGEKELTSGEGCVLSIVMPSEVVDGKCEEKPPISSPGPSDPSTAKVSNINGDDIEQCVKRDNDGNNGVNSDDTTDFTSPNRLGEMLASIAHKYDSENTIPNTPLTLGCPIDLFTYPATATATASVPIHHSNNRNNSDAQPCSDIVPLSSSGVVINDKSEQTDTDTIYKHQEGSESEDATNGHHHNRVLSLASDKEAGGSPLGGTCTPPMQYNNLGGEYVDSMEGSSVYTGDDEEERRMLDDYYDLDFTDDEDVGLASRQTIDGSVVPSSCLAQQDTTTSINNTNNSSMSDSGNNKSQSINPPPIVSDKKQQQPQRFTRTECPASADLAKLNLKEGMNIIRYKTVTSLRGAVVEEARIYLWGSGTKVCVSDVDGTITRSDIMGHLMPIIGRDWTHPGICDLYSKIAKNGYQFVYLTARSVSQTDVTRKFLHGIEQGGKKLPVGPIMTAPDRFFTALTQEVSKRSHEFKIACLQGIESAFPNKRRDGTPLTRRPFYAGFGNRVNDIIAYSACMIPSHKVFIIDHNSVVHVCRVKQSYQDLSHLVHETFPPLKKVFCVHQFPHPYVAFGMGAPATPVIDGTLVVPLGRGGGPDAAATAAFAAAQAALVASFSFRGIGRRDVSSSAEGSHEEQRGVSVVPVHTEGSQTTTNIQISDDGGHVRFAANDNSGKTDVCEGSNQDIHSNNTKSIPLSPDQQTLLHDHTQTHISSSSSTCSWINVTSNDGSHINSINHCVVNTSFNASTNIGHINDTTDIDNEFIDQDYNNFNFWRIDPKSYGDIP